MGFKHDLEKIYLGLGNISGFLEVEAVNGQSRGGIGGVHGNTRPGEGRYRGRAW